MSDYAVLDQPHKIYGVGGHVLEGIGTGTIYGTVLDIHKRQVLVHFTVFVVPGLGRNLLSVCLLYTSPSPRDGLLSRMPSST